MTLDPAPLPAEPPESALARREAAREALRRLLGCDEITAARAVAYCVRATERRV